MAYEGHHTAAIPFFDKAEIWSEISSIADVFSSQRWEDSDPSSENTRSQASPPEPSSGAGTSSRQYEEIEHSHCPVDIPTFDSQEAFADYIKTNSLNNLDLDMMTKDNLYYLLSFHHPAKSVAGQNVDSMIITLSYRSVVFHLYDEHKTYLGNVSYEASEELSHKEPMTGEEFLRHIKDNLWSPGVEIPAELRYYESKAYVLVEGGRIYWMTEDGYLAGVGLNSRTNYENPDEIFLLAQDVVFEKHTLK